MSTKPHCTGLANEDDTMFSTDNRNCHCVYDFTETAEFCMLCYRELLIIFERRAKNKQKASQSHAERRYIYIICYK